MEVDEKVKPFILKGKRTKRRHYSKLVDGSSDHGDVDLAHSLILLAQPHLRRRRRQKSSQPPPAGMDGSGIVGDEVYRCKTCDRSFGSFQALGGHRTSHQRPRRNQTDITGLDNQQLYDVVGCSSSSSLQIPNCRKSISSPNKKATNRVHECSICGAEFTSGQALGGHMRRHRPIHPVLLGTSDRQDSHVVEKSTRSCIFELDLNLPAPTEEDDELESKLKVKTKEEGGLVFSASSSSLVFDCHY